MGMVIGIDVGGSTTKIIGVDKEGIKHPCKRNIPSYGRNVPMPFWIPE